MGALGRRRVLASLGALGTTLSFGCRREGQRAGGGAGAVRRIISLSPNTTETLFALGVGDRVIGRSRYCDYPPAVTRIPVVGGYVDASLETILGLAPDLVVGARGPSGPALAERLGSLGIATYFPRTESMAEIDAMITELSVKAGVAGEGQRLVQRVRARREEVTRALGAEPRVSTLLVFGLSPIVVAGPGGFPDEMLKLVAAANVIREGGPYPAVGIEHLLVLDPEVIVNAASAEAHGGEGAGINLDAPGWRDLGAVKKGHVALLTDEAALRPGPRIGEGLAALARAIHPLASVP